MTRRLKFGVVGLGNIGSHHLSYLKAMDLVELVGVCDVDSERASRFATELSTTAYVSPEEMFTSSDIEAVLIAVPHFDHVPIAISAFQRGIHVLCEKPLAVQVSDAEKVITAYELAKQSYPNLVFGMMFNERTFPAHRKLKEIVDSGQLGQLVRATWINTKWFRTQSYYNSGSWRATWSGEGGGILTNQCPHNLDMYQWLFGLPARIRGHAHIGKYHDIEVEDEVTAYLEHDNGMIGHLIVSTAESPGTNRLEIVGEYGKLIFEEGIITLYQNEYSMLTYSRTTNEAWGSVPTQVKSIVVDDTVPFGHHVVTEQFVQAILNGCQLVAKGEEGIQSLMLANGIMLSSFTEQMIDVPFDSEMFARELQVRIGNSNH